MKSILCFTGFSGHELELLQEQASGLSTTWECDFHAKGEAVLLAMANKSYDVVIANVRLSDMSGAELLHHVGKLKSNTLCIAVGDLAEQNLVIDYLGGTHRFIARPFEPKELVSMVRRSLSLDAWLASDQLRALLPKLRRLPSLPITYFEVLKQIESPNTNVQDVGAVIANDPAVTARLLQMVNSAAFALAQKITDPVDAVSHLGMETVRSLVLCLQVFTEDETLKQAGISMEELWDHSLTVAKIARQIMLQLTSAPRLANDAFTAGLLHDIGRIVLATNLPKAYREILESSRQSRVPLHIEEIKAFGINHTQVGAYLLGVWGMPVGFVEAAALHHAPGHTDTSEISLLTAVHVANVLAYAEQPQENEIPPPPLDAEYLAKIGLPVDLDGWRKLLGNKSVTEPEPAEPEPPLEPQIMTPPQTLVESKPSDVTGPVILVVVLAVAITALTVVWIMSRR
jgi:putative nucleotidyltransferase with HDIG domain